MRRQVELAAAPKALGTFPILQALRAMGHRDTFGAIARRSTWPEGGGGWGINGMASPTQRFGCGRSLLGLLGQCAVVRYLAIVVL